MEKRLKELDGLLCEVEHACDMELITEYTSTKKALDEENAKWMTLSESLEKIKAML